MRATNELGGKIVDKHRTKKRFVRSLWHIISKASMKLSLAVRLLGAASIYVICVQ